MSRQHEAAPRRGSATAEPASRSRESRAGSSAEVTARASGGVQRPLSPAEALSRARLLGHDATSLRPAALPLPVRDSPFPIPLSTPAAGDPPPWASPRAPAAALTPSSLAGQHRLLQRVVVAQITVGERMIDEESDDSDEESELVIRQVSISGRPKSPFTSTMGDHTTAFAVHRLSLVQQLEGKTFEEGFDVLRRAINATHQLPGWDLVDDLPERHGEQLDKAEDHLWDLLYDEEEEALDPSPLELQEAIAAYLEYRELIPLSTINVRAKSPVHAGKGKGESGPAEVLVAHQAGTHKSVQERLDAVTGLFDASSVALAVVEQDDRMLGKMLPGLNASLEIIPRLNLLVVQHLRSIQQSFPLTFGSGLSLAAAKKELRAQVTVELEEWMIATATDLQERIGHRRVEIESEKNWMVSSTRKEKKERRARIKKLREGIEAKQAKLSDLQSTFEDLFGRPLSLKPAKKVTEVPGTHGNKRRKLEKAEGVELAPVPEDTEDTEEELDKKSPLASQIRLDGDDLITELIFAGRSPSPFPGTMGAHSTSWVVHLDHLRVEVEGQTVDEAFDTLHDDLVPEARKLAKRRTKSGDFPADGFQTGLLTAAGKELVRLEGLFEDASEEVRPFVLQQYITAYLTYVNFVPGATLEKADTGGKAEGINRGILRSFEDDGRQYRSVLKLAIDGLLDVQGASDDQAGELRKTHRKLIRVAYPDSYDAVFRGKHARQEIRQRLLSGKAKKTKTGKKRGRSWT